MPCRSAGLLLVALAAACVSPVAPARSVTPSGAPAAAGSAPPSAVSPSSWRRIADIPTPRSEVAAAVFRGEAYVIGGFGGGRAVERYSPGANAWSAAPELPTAVDHAMAAAIEEGDRAGVYVLGGNASGATARAFVLVPGATAWREITRMPGARSQAAAIPTPRDHLAAAALAGRVCAVGGRRLSLTTNLAVLECYDPARDAWERLSGAPTARGGVGAAAVGDRLVFVGGEQPQGTYREVEIYSAAARTWSRAPDLPTPRHGIGAVAIGSTVYVLTGGPTPGGSQTRTCEALAL